MKLKILLGWIVCLALLTVGHISANVGWGNFKRSVGETFGWERRRLYVGFLPVT